MLDKSRPYAEIYGDTHGRRYEQDGHYFGADGKPLEEIHIPARRGRKPKSEEPVNVES